MARQTRRGEARRGETVSLLASLTKAKHRPSLVHECGQLRLASPRGEASESRHPLARHEVSHARRAASKLASWPSLEGAFEEDIDYILATYKGEVTTQIDMKKKKENAMKEFEELVEFDDKEEPKLCKRGKELHAWKKWRYFRNLTGAMQGQRETLLRT